MKSNIHRISSQIISEGNCLFLTGIIFMFFVAGCNKFVDIPPPATSLTNTNVFTTNSGAVGAQNSIYESMASGWLAYLTEYPSLSADEADYYLTDESLSVYLNQLDPSTLLNVPYATWEFPYSVIYQENAVIEGVNNSSKLSPQIKQQLIGEAEFIRAFYYFYMVNLFGDVPLALTTDYKVNSTLARSPSTAVYQQIIKDLKDAEDKLSTNYLGPDVLTTTTDRLRPTKWAAAALLARTYLFTKNWNDAETEATTVINNTSQYQLVPLDNVFLKNSSEAIWQLHWDPILSYGENTPEGYYFILTTSPDQWRGYALDAGFLTSFEPNDNRRKYWIDTLVTGGQTYYYPYKYKVGTGATSVSENEMVLRMGELYLIRAEARAQQGNVGGAQSDLNAIRSRAGLPNTTANTQSTLLPAIMHERKMELFTETGHRWLDLKRTGEVDSVMTLATKRKGGTWKTNQQWYPIPTSDIQTDPNLKQNPGY